MAILDTREIEFDRDALVHCLAVSPRAAQGFGLPPMTPKDVRFNPQDGMVEVVYSSKEGLGAVRVSVESLGAILVSYCVRAKIPMPKVADKQIRIESDSIVLAFKTLFTKAPTPEGADSTSRAVEAVKSWKWVEAARPAGVNP